MRHVETLLIVVVGLAIVAALAWLTTRALESFLERAPAPAPTTARVAVPSATATASPRSTATPSPKLATPRPLPTRSPASAAMPSPRPSPTREPIRPSPSPASSARWSAPRDYRVEQAAKLHETPDAASHVIARLRPGTIVTVVAEQDGWLRIESSLGRRAGWLEAERVRPVRGGDR